MKKLLNIILIACIVVTAMAVAPVSAANDEVLYGTPTLDGKIDEIYKSSLTVVYDGTPEKNASDKPWPDASAVFYALYDGRNVYLAAEVKDDDVVSAADSYVYQNANPYGNDVVEFRLDFNGGDAFFKVGVDAYGKRAYTIQPDLCNIDDVSYATSITDDGYIVEVCIPYDTLDTNDVVAAGKLGFKIYLFDLFAEYEGIEAPKDGVHFGQYAMDFAGEGKGKCVFYSLSEEKATAPSAGEDKTDDTTAKKEDTTAGKTDDTTAKQDNTTTGKTDNTTGNPTTFDPTVIAVVLTAASGAAFVVASKKKH